MRLNDPRRMNHCRAFSEHQCDYPECSCALTHEPPTEVEMPNDQQTVQAINKAIDALHNGDALCPRCGNVMSEKKIGVYQCHNCKT